MVVSLDSVCDEFVSELVVSNGKLDIQSTLNSLEWSVPVCESPGLLTDVCGSVNVAVYSPSVWKPVVAVHKSSVVNCKEGGFPCGISEFIKLTVRSWEEGAVSMELLDSLTHSKYLPVSFPEIIRRGANHVRCVYRSSKCELGMVLEVFRAIINNRNYKMTQTDFDLSQAVLITLIVDINSLVENVIRIEAANILKLLIDEKAGYFHSRALIKDLQEKIFSPIIGKLAEMPRLENVLNACIFAKNTLA